MSPLGNRASEYTIPQTPPAIVSHAVPVQRAMWPPGSDAPLEGIIPPTTASPSGNGTMA